MIPTLVWLQRLEEEFLKAEFFVFFVRHSKLLDFRIKLWPGVDAENCFLDWGLLHHQCYGGSACFILFF